MTGDRDHDPEIGDNDNDNDDFRLDRLLDGEADYKEPDRVEEREEWLVAKALQHRIDDSIRRNMASGELLDEKTLMDLLQRENFSGHRSPQTYWRANARKLWSIVAAAAILLAVGTWLLTESNRVDPVFQPRSLALIYNETVQSGFRPYYLCDDDQRFTDTFENRVGVPLSLGELPPGRTMLGLSYPGGISRNTTAMLCTVDEAKVIVFVDRKNESGVATAVQTGTDQLNVFVRHKGDLVFCEVTPLEKPSMIEFMLLPN